MELLKNIYKLVSSYMTAVTVAMLISVVTGCAADGVQGIRHWLKRIASGVIDYGWILLFVGLLALIHSYMGDDEEVEVVIKSLSYAALAMYVVKIIRNAAIISPDSQFLRILNKLVTLKIMEKSPEVAEVLNEKEDKNENITKRD